MITMQGESVKLTDPHRHKYASAMAEYMDGLELDWSGNVECPTGAYAQCGRRLLVTDSRGFVSHETYPEAGGAEQMFAALDGYYSEWDWEEWDEEERTDDQQAEILSRCDRYCSYVHSCAMENFAAHSFDMWMVHGQPTSYIGGAS